jgi:hypothetical protein
VSVKLLMTGFEEVVVVPDADDELAELPPDPELDDPELLDEPDDPEPLDEPDAPDEPLPLEALEVDPAFALDVLLLLLEPPALAPLPLEPPWASEPPEAPPACPEAEPLVLLLPAVVPWVPPTVPSSAATGQRTVVLFALSIDPVSTT